VVGVGGLDQLPAPGPDFIDSHEDPHFALAFARIECHYFVNGGFFDVEDQLLRDAHRCRASPA
jgi:proline iminopeptidase